MVSSKYYEKLNNRKRVFNFGLDVASNSFIPNKLFDEEGVEFYDLYNEKKDVAEKYHSDVDTFNQFRFQLTDNFSIMRFVRAVFFIQTIAIMSNYPSFKLPTLSQSIYGHILTYSLKFYSLIFVNFSKLIQFYSNLILNSFRSINNPVNNPSADYAAVLLSEFVLAIYFIIVAVLFTILYWEILDYADKMEVSKWLRQYATNLWLRTGGVYSLFLVLMMISVFYVSFVFVLAMSNEFQFSPFFYSNTIYFLTLISVSVLILSWISILISLFLVRLIYSYFSSINYDKTLILKQLTKSKVEIGIALMLILYMPIFYEFIQALILVDDWNDNLARSYRKSINNYKPCYFLAFSPYFQNDIQVPSTCSSSYFNSTIDNQEFYMTEGIFGCDSYLGISIFTIAVIASTFTFLGYGWIFREMILTAESIFKSSSYVPVIVSLNTIYKDEINNFKKFSVSSRFLLSCKNECKRIISSTFIAIVWIVFSSIELCLNLIKIVLYFARSIIVTSISLSKRCSQICFKLRRQKHVTAGQGISCLQHLNDKISQINKVGHDFISLSSQLMAKRKRHLLENVLNIESSSILNRKVPLNSRNVNITEFGVKQGEWRLDKLIEALASHIHLLNREIVAELRVGRKGFESDNLLSISVFDRTMNVSGIFVLICQYKWDRMYWSLVLWLEMSIIAVVGALLKLYTSWDIRCITICCLSVGFGIVSNIFQPYSEDEDKWLELAGRLLVIIFTIGNVFYTDGSRIDFSSASDQYQTIQPNITVDFIVSFVFIVYIVNVSRVVGLWQLLNTIFVNIRILYNNQILNHLVATLNKRNLGSESLIHGMKLMCQWDDIIDQQKHNFYLSIPSVQPCNLVSMSYKLSHLQWASLFNLKITNLKTPLNLNILHIMMSSANTEVAAWLMFRYPKLITMRDYQGDTPVSISLKEFAYFLHLYGLQNNGLLDDDTSFSDDFYAQLYPEIDEFRDLVYEHGEFHDTNFNSYDLTGKDISFIENNSYYNHIPPQNDTQESLGRRQSNFAITASTTEILSILEKRFDDDNYLDEFESGNLLAWRRFGFKIPDAIYNSNGLSETDRNNESIEQKQEDNDALDLPNLSFYRSQLATWYDNIASDLDNLEIRKEVRFPISLRNIKEIYENNVPIDHPISTKINDWKVSSFSKVKAFLSRNDDFNMVEHTDHLNPEFETDVKFPLCKYTELFLSEEFVKLIPQFAWDVSTFKNMAVNLSQEHARLTLNLAYTLNLGPPPGFSRISEWLLGVSKSVFYFKDEDNAPILVKSAVAIIDQSEALISSIAKATEILKLKRKYSQYHEDTDDKYSPLQTKPFCDRIVQFLAECLVASRSKLDLSDSELSVHGRLGWRAVARACRLRNSSLVIPSSFVNVKQICLTSLSLSRNELDDGDAILVADILLFQHSLINIDLSFNSIGSRGMIRMCKVLKSHESLISFNISHNRVGPLAGKDIGIWLKFSKMISVLNLSYNKLGELSRYPTYFRKEYITSAAKDICAGLRLNVSLQSLDISYNQMGSSLSENLPYALARHPNLIFLNISGNNIGGKAGAILLYAMSGEPNGEKLNRIREKMYAVRRQELLLTDIGMSRREAAIMQASFEVSDSTIYDGNITPKTPGTVKNAKTVSGNMNIQDMKKHALGYMTVPLVELDISNNQLGALSGYALASFIKRNASLTSLNISDNSLGFIGGEAITDALERTYNIKSKDIIKAELEKIEEEAYVARSPAAVQARLRNQIAVNSSKSTSNLIHLDISKNFIGPKSFDSILNCLASPNCTITYLDISNNPLGMSSPKDGDATSIQFSRLSQSNVLSYLNMENTYFLPTQLVSFFGGIMESISLCKLSLTNVNFDEPTSLQCSYAMKKCSLLTHIDFENCKIGPKGGALLLNNIEEASDRLIYLNLNGNLLGYTLGQLIGKIVSRPSSSIKTLKLGNNALLTIGSKYIVQGLVSNASLTELDLSYNSLDFGITELLSLLPRGIYLNGEKIGESNLSKINISNNEAIGFDGSIQLFNGFVLGNFEYLNVSNIGAGYNSAEIISAAFRDVGIRWKYLDISYNKIGREGMNLIFWAIRHSRHIRYFNCSNIVNSGVRFGTDEDGLLNHGISVLRAIRANVMLRVLDLSNNALSASSGCNIFDALIDNYSIKKIVLKSNFFDDNVANKLSELLRFNNTIESIDISDNRLGFNCILSISEGLSINHSLKTLILNSNELGNSGTIVAESFVKSLLINQSLKVLCIDDNKFGPDWAIHFRNIIVRNTVLTKLSLKNNRFDEQCAKFIVDSYVNSKYLLEIGLSRDEIGKSLWEELLKSSNLKKSTSEMGFTDENIIYEDKDNCFTEMYEFK